MPSPSGKFSATAERSLQSGLETGRCESGGVCCEIWSAQGRDGRSCEEEKAYATRDRPDAERALEYKPLRELPDLSPMKRIVTHPPEPKSGRQYWRSTAELSDTPEFRAWLEREFPSGAAQLNGDEWSRRSFLKLMGASVALAGFGVSSCRRPEAHLVPFTKSVEWTIPGKFLYYTTAMPRRNGAIPLLVTTVDGRPIKLDGNPLHPASNGGSDVFAQAAIHDLYNPERARRFTENGKTADYAALEKYLGDLRGKMQADGGAGLAFLVEETHSPTGERMRAELAKMFPKMRWCVYDPLLS